MSVSRLDQVYRTILLSKYFTKGWGKPEVMKRLFRLRKTMSNRETCRHLVSPYYPVTVKQVEANAEYRLLEGKFVSPFVRLMGDILPEESHTAHFQMVLPVKWKHPKHRPVCIHLAGTGDHYFWRRRTFMARPLIREFGIGSIILENPFYGSRKPKDYVRSNLHNVTDIFLMGGCLILECMALLHWCERNGYGPLGISGISMGGFMASLAASNWHKPLSLIPCLSWSSASGVFTQGVMSGAIDWTLLENQYCTSNEYREEILQMIKGTPQDAAFVAGRDFVQRFPEFSTDLVPGPEDNFPSRETSSFLSNFEDPFLTLDEARHAAQVHVHSSHCPHPSHLVETQSHAADEIARAVGRAGSLGPETTSTGTSYEVKSGTEIKSSVQLKPIVESKAEGVKKWIRFGSYSGSSADSALRMEALQFMRGIMDECTYIGNFTVPVDQSLIIVVAAKSDGYVPRGDGLPGLDDLWPQSEIRYIDMGHVAAFIFNQGAFRKAIADSFTRLATKYYS